MQLPNNIFELLTQLSDVFEKASKGKACMHKNIHRYTVSLQASLP